MLKHQIANKLFSLILCEKACQDVENKKQRLQDRELNKLFQARHDFMCCARQIPIDNDKYCNCMLSFYWEGKDLEIPVYGSHEFFDSLACLLIDTYHFEVDYIFALEQCYIREAK